MVKHYNGFTPSQRTKAGRWERKRKAAGTWVAPTQCAACGQKEGFLMRHSEDYNEPYGAHIGAFELCYPCHMMVHCRHHDLLRWRRYCEALRRGARPLTFPVTSYPRFMATYLKGPMGDEVFTWHEPLAKPAFDAIPDEQPDLFRRVRQGQLFDGSQEEDDRAKAGEGD